MRLILGECLEVLRTLEADSIDACVTDPPYGLEFMGVAWDTFADRAKGTARTRNEWGDFGSREHARTSNERGRIARKKALAYQRFAKAFAVEVLRVLKPGAYILAFGAPRTYHRLASGIEDAGFEIRDGLQWLFGSGFPKSLNLGDGRGTALKPGHEPIVLGLKPTHGTFADNLARYGTAALNIDACRLDGGKNVPSSPRRAAFGDLSKASGDTSGFDPSVGRWPANVLLDEFTAALLDEQSGELVSGGTPFARGSMGYHGRAVGQPEVKGNHGDRGGASRFYYVAKASRAERDLGCEDQPRGNFHPTVKPLELMRWLVRLVAPPGGTVLDPFMGSGTTGMACVCELREFIGIEREPDYLAIAERRIRAIAPLFSEQTA